MIRAHKCSSIILALAIDALPTYKLFVKKNHNFLLGLSNDGSAKSKWNVLSHGGVHVHYSVAHLEILRRSRTEG